MGINSAKYCSSHPGITQLRSQAADARAAATKAYNSGQMSQQDYKGTMQQINGEMKSVFGQANSNTSNPGHLTKDEFQAAQQQLVNLGG